MKPPGTNHRWRRIPLLTALAVVIGLLGAVDAQAQAADPRVGEVLPMRPPKRPPITEMDWRKVKTPERFEVKPPKGAPNVVIVLLDQLAYAVPATFGGQIRMPTLDALAKEGLTYTNFRVNSLCSPSPFLCPFSSPKQPPGQHLCRRGCQHVVPRRYGCAARQRRHDRRDPAALGLRHLLRRQEP